MELRILKGGGLSIRFEGFRANGFRVIAFNVLDTQSAILASARKER